MRVVMFFLLIFSSCIATSEFKKITIYKIVYLLGVPQKEQIAEETFFDTRGRKEKEISYKNDGTIDLIVIYKYNRMDSVVESNAVTKDSTFVFRETKNYDEQGSRKELIYYSAEKRDNYKYKNIAEYDKQGRMTQLSWYWPEGLKSVNKCQYVGKQKISNTEYDPQGKINCTWNYKYKGDLLGEIAQLSPAGAEVQKTVYEYDSSHRVIKESNYNGGQLRSYSILTYSNRNLITSKIDYSASGKISVKYRYEYE